MHVPRSLLPLPSTKVDQLLAVPLAATTGVGGLLTDFLDRLAAEQHGYSAADLSRLSHVLVDLLVVALAHELDADIPSAAAEATLFPRITTFVKQHLDDPGLTPATIAAEHHISVSYLHRLFQGRDVTLASWIRSLRLERARRDLTDPRLRDVPIHRVAARWGFRAHATFTRAFRATFGLPPTTYRSAGLGSAAATRP